MKVHDILHSTVRKEAHRGTIPQVSQSTLYPLFWEHREKGDSFIISSNTGETLKLGRAPLAAQETAAKPEAQSVAAAPKHHKPLSALLLLPLSNGAHFIMRLLVNAG